MFFVGYDELDLLVSRKKQEGLSMLCPHCNKRETKTPKFTYCNACYVAQYKKSRRGYAQYGRNGHIAFKRSNNQCERCCASGERLEIHHIDGNGSTKHYSEQNNAVSNLFVLCKKCHAEVEKYRREEAGTIPRNYLQGRWSLKHDYCVTCGRADQPHTGRGLCMRCRKKLPHNREKRRQRYQKKRDQLRQIRLINS